MTLKRILLPIACAAMLALPAQAAAPQGPPKGPEGSAPLRGPLPTQAQLDAAREQATRFPESAEAQFELAMHYARTPYLEQGWEVLKRVNTLDPAYADKVVAKYEPQIVADPAQVEARFRLAFAYYFQGKKELAREQMERVVALSPQDPWGYNYLGFLVAEQNQLDEAFRLWQQALAIDPNNAVAHYLVGQVYYRQGKFMQAAASLANALKSRSSSGLKP